MAVSVIIPTFNRAPLVVRAVESVLAQTYKDIEAIVIDDGSTDGTEAALAPYRDKIVYVHQYNQGVVAARNKGLQIAKSEFIAFLDSDDFWLPWKIALQLRCMELRPDLVLTWTNCFEVDDRGTILQADFLRKYQECYRHFTDESLFETIIPISDFEIPALNSVVPLLKSGPMSSAMFMGNLIITPTAMFRADVLKISGVFDPEMGQAGEDYDLFWRMADVGPFGLADVPAMYFRRGGGDHLHAARTQMAVSNLKTICKYLVRHPEGPALNRKLVSQRLTESYEWVGLAKFDDDLAKEARGPLLTAMLRGSRRARVYLYFILSLLPIKITEIARLLFQRVKRQTSTLP